jgi:hypothetical protein
MKEAPMALAHNPTGHLIKILVESLKKVYTYKRDETH